MTLSVSLADVYAAQVQAGRLVEVIEQITSGAYADEPRVRDKPTTTEEG